MLPIHILGSGAMACLWASYFNDQQLIQFILRSTNEKHFNFVIKPLNKPIKGSAVTATSIASPIEHLIVATKAFDAMRAIDSIQHQLSKNAQIILLQNGMGSQQNIAKKFSQYAVYACSSTEGAYKMDAHTLMHAGKGVNHIGAMNAKARQSELAKWLPEQRFQWHDDIEPILWKKLIINCAINPLTIIYNCKNGELLNQPHIKQHMEAICQELDQVICHMPFSLPSAFQLATDVCQQTANNFSSMYQDGKHNKPTEIDFITGYILNKCQELSIECPENLKLYQQVKKLNVGP